MPNSSTWRFFWTVIILCAVPTAWAVDNTNRSPVISCRQPEFHVGTIQQGELVKHIFTIQNKGEGTLSIKRVSGG